MRIYIIYDNNLGIFKLRIGWQMNHSLDRVEAVHRLPHLHLQPQQMLFSALFETLPLPLLP